MVQKQKRSLVTDNLNTHQSEALVHMIAKMEGISEEALGVKEKSGIDSYGAFPLGTRLQMLGHGAFAKHVVTKLAGSFGGRLTHYYNSFSL